MKGFYAILLILTIFILSACNSSENISPVREETIDFDIKLASEMIEEKERIIISLADKERLSISEVGELEKSLNEKFGDHARDILSMFITNIMESNMYVIQDTFYPTVFHEGINITNAVIYKSYYEDDFFNETRLSIREEYVGDDEKLEGWNREYIFTQNKDGNWEIYGFSGVMNFSGEEYDMNYLELLRGGSSQHEYNGVILHVIETDPSKISLHAIDENVTLSGKEGINGGFFWDKQLLSIAVNDGEPVNGKPKQFGSGWFNIKFKRGTIVYDKVTRAINVQIAASVEDLQVTDMKRFWAQGGVSMSLQNNANWRSVAVEEEALPFPDDERLRSAMIYDSKGEIYLIVSSTKCTAERFREAILHEVSVGDLVDGIFLDGDGSSQFLLGDDKLAGDNRTVLQMITVNE